MSQKVQEALDELEKEGKIKKRSEKEKAAYQKSMRRIGEHYVKQWKFDRALYKKYGGKVIFQQANPQEPVGAYRQFLEEMEQAKVFEVFDEENRKKFWHYFRREHPFEMPAEKANFDQPWWLQE